MARQFRVRSAAEQVGEYYLDEHDAIGPATLGEMADRFGTNKSAVRAGLRLAEPVLNSQGKALKVAARAAGYKVETTTDLTKFQVSTYDRLTAFATEFVRYAAHEKAVAGPDETLIFKEIADCLAWAKQELDEASV